MRLVHVDDTIGLRTIVTRDGGAHDGQMKKSMASDVGARHARLGLMPTATQRDGRGHDGLVGVGRAKAREARAC